MQEQQTNILIGFGDFAEFLGVSIRRVFRHREAMQAAGVIEDHIYQGRFYSVCCPEHLNRFWKNRRFD